MATTKEKVENEVALHKVEEADQKVLELVAAKEAKKQEKHAKRIAKHPKMGHVDNMIADNAIGFGAGLALGGPLGVLAVVLLNKHKKNKSAETDVETDTDSSESEPLPFEE